MRALCREHDWPATRLGPVEQWPPTLRTSVQMVLGSGIPHVVLWGRELIQVYNDAYAELIQSKHPRALGRGNLETWPEVAHLNAPIYEQVFRGETVKFDNALYPLLRSGKLEDVYLIISYSPIWDADGTIVGVLAGMVETTQDVAFRALQAERERLFRELEVERGRLTTVFQQAPAVIATLRGPDHVFDMANPPYFQVVGHRDILGRPVREALPEIVEQGFVALLDQVYATGVPFVGTELPVLLQREAGGALEERFFNLVYQPLADADGSSTGILAHGVDVTEQVRARQEVEEKAEELDRLTRALKATNEELDQFAYVASHDLKAPLRGISSIASWIEEDLGDGASGEVREHLGRLRGRVVRMEGLIDGILQYSRAGRVRDDSERVDTRALVREVIELLAPPAGAVVQVEGELPVLETERLPLQQVLMNLVGNAIKYGGGAQARVEVSARPAGDDGWEFAVRDHGPGIAPQYHEKVWTIFQTLNARDKVEGTGIGLSVVKKLVESRGGTVALESAPGEGAVFRFLWPAEPRRADD